MKRRIAVFLFVLSWLCVGLAAADEKTVTASGKFAMGDLDSKSNAKKIALMNAKQMALEKAGTFLTSYSEVQNYELTKDEISSLAAGLMSVEVIDEQWSMEGETPTVTLTIRAVIDTANLDSQVRNLKESEAVVDGMQQMEAELADLRAELEALKKEKKTLKTTESGDKAELSSIDRKEQETVDKMISLDALSEARSDLHRGDPAAAISRLDKVIAENPNNGRAYVMRAWAHYRMGENGRAKTDIDKALEIYPKSPKALLLKGTLELKSGNARQALQVASKAISLDPRCARCYVLMGESLIRMKQFRQAYQSFRQACKMGETKGCTKARAMEEKKKMRSQNRPGKPPKAR